MKMEECWLDELSKEGGEIYDNKGNILTTMQLSKALAECERWFTMYYMAAKNNEIPDFDPSCVKETELDIMREVVHYKHGPLGVSLRGKVDWAIDLDGPVAKLADLKTASTHWMGRWGKQRPMHSYNALLTAISPVKIPNSPMWSYLKQARRIRALLRLNTTRPAGISTTT